MIIIIIGTEIPDGQLRKDLGDGDHKYLGILEANKMRMGEMKVRVRKEYYRRIRKLLTSKVNGGNMIKAITHGLWRLCNKLLKLED